MPRSSRHKSSKHSSREAREYSDSEKDSLKESRRSKEDGARVSSSTEKRKEKEYGGGGSGNGEYSVAEDYGSSSKRRKERASAAAAAASEDRWNGGGDEDRRDKKSSKASADSRSKRREDSVGAYDEVEVKKSEGRHRDKDRGRDRDRDRDRDSSRKDGRDRDRDGPAEKKSKDEQHRSSVAKQVLENSDLNAHDGSESPELDNQLERRTRKRRDSSVDLDKYQDDMVDLSDRRLSSRDDSKDGRQRDEKRKEERYKEKHREEIDRENKHRDDRQKDERLTKDHISSRSEDKHTKDEKDAADMQSKKSKLHDGDRKGENERDRERHRELSSVRDRDRDRERHRDREREYEHDRGRDRNYDRDHDWDWDGDRDRDRDRDRERDRERDRDRERERDRDRDRERERDRDRDYDRDHDQDLDRDYGGSQPDERASRYKDSSRAKRRSPDERDDFSDVPSRGTKARYSDVEKKSSSGDRPESDANKGKSNSRQAHVDTIVSSEKRRNSPSLSPHIGLDDDRHLNSEDLKHKDSSAEPKSKAVASKDVTAGSGVLERGSKYRSMEKPPKMDDNTIGELPNEKSSSSKASPTGLIERSPSTSSIERRYSNRNTARRSLEIEETGRRSNADGRDFPIADDRQGRDLPSEKPVVDESSPVDSSFYNRSSQGNSSLIPPHSTFRQGGDSPFIGSLEDDSRMNSNSRYRRSVDPNMGRGHSNNAWRGVPNWPAPLPNGLFPFQHGPPGGFQGMVPQFPGPLYGVRPSMELNHAGLPYHLPDADRFSGHLRPIGWQNMMDGSGPSHLHGWDGSNGVFRDEPHMYGSAEWDQNRHPMNSRGRESSVDPWKGQNGDAKRDLISPSRKDDYSVRASAEDGLVSPVGQVSNREHTSEKGIQGKLSEKKSAVASSAEESLPKVTHEKKLDPSKSSKDDVSYLGRYYLSKLDISVELAPPDLYNKCMSLVNLGQTAIFDDESSRPIMAKDVLRAGVKVPSSWFSLHFPSIKDSVFQRAMDLYNKQRIELGRKPTLSKRAFGVVSDPEQEHVDWDAEKVDDSVPASDAEMVDASNSNPDPDYVDPASSAAGEEKLEVVLAPLVANEVQDHINVLVKDDIQYSLAEPQAEGSFPEPTVKLEVTSVDNALEPKANGGGHNAEEGVDSGEGVKCRVLDPVGSPKDCEAMMSNESESVNLSRIHHSPESTH